jgi:hypothetical protein
MSFILLTLILANTAACDSTRKVYDYVCLSTPSTLVSAQLMTFMLFPLFQLVTLLEPHDMVAGWQGLLSNLSSMALCHELGKRH